MEETALIPHGEKEPNSAETGSMAVGKWNTPLKTAWRSPGLTQTLLQVYLAHRKGTSLGPYRRPMPRVLGGFLGGWAFSYGRRTPPCNGFPEALTRHRVD